MNRTKEWAWKQKDIFELGIVVPVYYLSYAGGSGRKMTRLGNLGRPISKEKTS